MLQIFKSVIFDFIKHYLLEMDELLFIPYSSIGDFAFGCSEVDFLRIHNMEYQNNVGVNGKKIYEKDSFIFRFDKDRLTQVYLENIDRVHEVKLNSKNINTLKGVEELLEQYIFIDSKTHFIFPDLGLSIHNNIMELEDLEFFFFDRSLLPFWENIYRPITSW